MAAASVLLQIYGIMSKVFKLPLLSVASSFVDEAIATNTLLVLYFSFGKLVALFWSPILCPLVTGMCLLMPSSLSCLSTLSQF